MWSTPTESYVILLMLFKGEPDGWIGILRGVAQIKTTISLVALALVALVLVLRFAGTKPNRQLVKLLNLGLVLLTILALVPFLASWYLDVQNARHKGIYRVRVTSVGMTGLPNDDVHVWTNLDAVPKKVDGGWEFDIPAAARTAEGHLEIYSRDNQTGDTGKTLVALGNDENLAVSIPLMPQNAQVRGMITDKQGHPLSGVRILVVGYSSESALSDESGGFELKSHVAAGKEVKLHAEKKGFQALEDYFLVGGSPISMSLSKQ